MPAYEVTLKTVAPVRVAKAGGVAPNMESLGPTLDHLFDSVLEYIGQHGGTPVGPAITLYLSMGEQDIHVEACMPFNGMLNDGEQVKVVELPAVETMASTIHRGSFSTLNEAYNAVTHWVETNGYRISGPNRELNLVYERGGDQSRFVTEIQFPVEKQ